MAEITNEVKKGVVIDPFDKSLDDGVIAKINPEADAWSVPAPAPGVDEKHDGKYDLQLFPSKDGWEQRAIDDKKDSTGDNVYYQCNLECKIVGGEFEGQRVFPRVNTQLYRGREISSMMGLFLLGGNKLPKEELTGKQQMMLFANWLKKEPIIRNVTLDWNAWSKNDKKNIFKSMSDFPKTEDGNYKHIFKHTCSDRSMEEITAQLQVVSWANKKKDEKKGAKIVKNSNSGKKEEKTVMEEVSVDDELANLLNGE